MTSAQGFLDRAARRADTLPLAWIGAAMLGCSTAFFCFAMPQHALDAALGTLGLPVPAGAIARLLFVLCCAGLAAGLGWLAVTVAGSGASAADVERDLSAAPAQPRRRAIGPSDPSEALGAPLPTLLAVRRGDGHPDAPPRRPIFADHDLPALDDEELLIAEAQRSAATEGVDLRPAAEPAPQAEAPGDVRLADPEPPTEGLVADPDDLAQEPVAAAEPDVDPELASVSEEEPAPAADPEPAAAAETEIDAISEAEPAAAVVAEEPLELAEALLPAENAPLAAVEPEQANDEAPPSADQAPPDAAEAPSPFAEVLPAAAEAPADTMSVEAAPAAETAAPPAAEAAEPPVGEPSLAELMVRLETGLDRRPGDAPADTSDGVTSIQDPPLAPDDALRNALEALQRLAARQR